MAEWFYRFDGKDLGPISEEDLRHVFESGALPFSTFVWRDGMSDWKPAGNCVDLSSPLVLPQSILIKEQSKTEDQPRLQKTECPLVNTNKIKLPNHTPFKVKHAFLICAVLIAVCLAWNIVKKRSSNTQTISGNNKSPSTFSVRQKAESGDASAQLELAEMYDGGKGVEPDRAVAADWARKAADQGNSEAQMFLGVAYELGRGIPRDHAEARKWYSKALAQGNPDAKKMLESLDWSDGVSEITEMATQRLFPSAVWPNFVNEIMRQYSETNARENLFSEREMQEMRNHLELKGYAVAKARITKMLQRNYDFDQLTQLSTRSPSSDEKRVLSPKLAAEVMEAAQEMLMDRFMQAADRKLNQK